MTNVSKKFIKKEIRKKIQNQFVSIVASINKSGEAEGFVGDFFTESEEMMFYKRLAIIFMIDSGISHSAIHKTLKVSRNTVFNLAKNLDRGYYTGVLNQISSKKNRRKEFVVDLEVLLRMGMPEMGKGRWKFLNEYMEKKK